MESQTMPDVGVDAQTRLELIMSEISDPTEMDDVTDVTPEDRYLAFDDDTTAESHTLCTCGESNQN